MNVLLRQDKEMNLSYQERIEIGVEDSLSLAAGITRWLRRRISVLTALLPRHFSFV
jgi:hypothetical protein